MAAESAETRIAARIERAAREAGVSLRYEDLHVGLFPPVVLRKVSIEKAGLGVVTIDSISARPQFRGPRGFGLLARVKVGTVTVSLPADLDALLHPTEWEIDPDVAIFLRGPVEGLAFTAGHGPKGRAFDLVANRLNLDAIGSVALEGDSSKALGFIDGKAHIEGDPRKDFQATWRVAGFGGESGGTLLVFPGKDDAKVQFQS